MQSHLSGSAKGMMLDGGAGRPLSRRAALFGIAAIAARPAVAASARYDAIVGDVDAAPRGTARFSTLQQAVDAAPGGAEPYRIRIAPGRHAGRTRVTRANVHITGQGARTTLLAAATAAGDIAPDGRPFGTFRTATLAIEAPGCRIEGVAIENAFDAPLEMRRPGGWLADEGGGQQAIALSLSRGADRTIVLGCAIRSHQDTLYCAEGRALLRDCEIAGSYDFIFGGAAARFERCTIVSRPRIKPAEGYVAAPSTLLSQPAGLVFDACRLVRERGVPDASVFLGRPWRTSAVIDGRRIGDPQSVGMAAYLRCRLDGHIAPTGWTRMWYTGADGNPRTWFEPEQARFCEYRNTGPGARGARRGRMLTPEQVARLSRNAMFGDWMPRP